MLHLDLGAARRVIVTQLGSVLAGQFQGTIQVTRLAHLSVFGVRGVDATVAAPDGTEVIVAKGAAVRISPLTLAKGALANSHELKIQVDSIRVDHVEANLDSAPDGSLKLVHAFDPKTPPTPPSPNDRATVIDLASIGLTHAWVHGQMAGVPPIDADIGALDAAFLSTASVTKLDARHLTLAARGLPKGIEVQGVVGAALALPADASAADRRSRPFLWGGRQNSADGQCRHAR